jgi:predicted transcriptional regulator
MHLSDAEWAVMDAVWDAGRPVRAREVHDRVAAAPGWAYTTVKTLLDRLAAKGALRADREGRATLFSARVTRAEARRSALGSLLERAFDGAAAPLLRFVVEEEGLSRRERADLVRLLRRERSKGRGPR